MIFTGKKRLKKFTFSKSKYLSRLNKCIRRICSRLYQRVVKPVTLPLSRHFAFHTFQPSFVWDHGVHLTDSKLWHPSTRTVWHKMDNTAVNLVDCDQLVYFQESHFEDWVDHLVFSERQPLEVHFQQSNYEQMFHKCLSSLNRLRMVWCFGLGVFPKKLDDKLRLVWPWLSSKIWALQCKVTWPIK